MFFQIDFLIHKYGTSYASEVGAQNELLAKHFFCEIPRPVCNTADLHIIFASTGYLAYYVGKEKLPE